MPDTFVCRATDIHSPTTHEVALYDEVCRLHELLRIRDEKIEAAAVACMMYMQDAQMQATELGISTTMQWVGINPFETRIRAALGVYVDNPMKGSP